MSLSAAGLEAGKPVAAEWSTVVGNRVNCTGTCWTFASIPLGSAPAAADGTARMSLEVPDGLGGWHVVQVSQGGEVKAQISFYVKRSVISAPRRVKAGQPFQIHLKGVGWTQLDNTVAVTYDNGYIGYGCGFNSNGDVVLDLVATGGPGTHLIDIYPLLYPYQPAYAYPPHAAIPFLNFARDFRALRSATSCRRSGSRSPSSSNAVSSEGRGRAPLRRAAAALRLVVWRGRASEPRERGREPPVVAAEHGHQRGHEHAAHERRVEHDSEREREAELLQAGD